MTVQCHPSKEDHQRYRVQVRALKVWRYFSPRVYGSMEKARLAAEEYQAKLDDCLHYKAVRAALPINRVFRSNGSVKGLSRRWKIRNGKVIEIFALRRTINGERYSTDIVITNRTFIDAYERAQAKLLNKLNLKIEWELTQGFKDAEYLYKMATNKKPIIKN